MGEACPKMHPWYVLRAWSGRETAIRDALDRAQLDTYLPLVKTRHRWSDRIKVFDAPLFPGYVFTRFDAAASRAILLRIQGVLGILGDGEPVPVPEDEIARVRALEASGLPLTVAGLVEGQTVRIAAGPLRDMEGIVLRMPHPNRARVVVSLPVLHRSVATEVDLDWLEPVRTKQRAA